MSRGSCYDVSALTLSYAISACGGDCDEYPLPDQRCFCPALIKSVVTCLNFLLRVISGFPLIVSVSWHAFKQKQRRLERPA